MTVNLGIFAIRFFLKIRSIQLSVLIQKMFQALYLVIVNLLIRLEDSLVFREEAITWLNLGG